MTSNPEISSTTRSPDDDPELKLAHVLIGSSGTGKSSTIEMFTNEDIYVCDTSNSGTKETLFYSDSKDEKITWVDTQGAQDSDNRLSDEDILSDVFRGLNQRKITHVKIGWMVNRELRCTPVLQSQAKFINSLCEGRIWDSVSIFCKQGTNVKSIAGALDAAKKNGAKKDLNHLNFTLLEKLKEDDNILLDIQERIEENENNVETKKDIEWRFKRGYFRKDEIKVKINEIFLNMKSCEILKLNEKCTKCGETGDSRGFKAECHYGEPVYKHSKSLGHPGETIQKHPGKILCDHKGKVNENRYHKSEELYNKTLSKTEYVHPEKYIHYHGSKWDSRTGSRIVSGIFTFGLSETKNTGIWRCCQSTDWEGEGCREKWKCCNDTDRHAKGCKTNIINITDKDKTHKCCERKAPAPGCETDPKWTCCDLKEGKVDCTRKYYSCCNSIDINGEGCEEYHSCCNLPTKYNTTGCKYLCCGGSSTSKCSKPRCKKCDGDWGTEAVGCEKGADNHKIVTIN